MKMKSPEKNEDPLLLLSDETGPVRFKEVDRFSEFHRWFESYVEAKENGAAEFFLWSENLLDLLGYEKDLSGEPQGGPRSEITSVLGVAHRYYRMEPQELRQKAWEAVDSESPEHEDVLAFLSPMPNEPAAQPEHRTIAELLKEKNASNGNFSAGNLFRFLEISPEGGPFGKDFFRAAQLQMLTVLLPQKLNSAELWPFAIANRKDVEKLLKLSIREKNQPRSPENAEAEDLSSWFSRCENLLEHWGDFLSRQSFSDLRPRARIDELMAFHLGHFSDRADMEDRVLASIPAMFSGMGLNHFDYHLEGAWLRFFLRDLHPDFLATKTISEWIKEIWLEADRENRHRPHFSSFQRRMATLLISHLHAAGVLDWFSQSGYVIPDNDRVYRWFVREILFYDYAVERLEQSGDFSLAEDGIWADAQLSNLQKSILCRFRVHGNNGREARNTLYPSKISQPWLKYFLGEDWMKGALSDFVESVGSGNWDRVGDAALELLSHPNLKTPLQKEIAARWLADRLGLKGLRELREKNPEIFDNLCVAIYMPDRTPNLPELGIRLLEKGRDGHLKEGIEQASERQIRDSETDRFVGLYLVSDDGLVNWVEGCADAVSLLETLKPFRRVAGKIPEGKRSKREKVLEFLGMRLEDIVSSDGIDKGFDLKSLIKEWKENALQSESKPEKGAES